MYTSHIGKKFLKLYNEKENKELSARQFFDEIMFPLFFDNEKHLMHVSNSPFFQRPSKTAMESGSSKSKLQLEKLHNDIEKDSPNMAIYVGFAAKDIEGTTSGQLTDIDFEIDAEDMYASWIGEALALGISGGFVILLDKINVLWGLYSGWKYYRKYLSQTPNIKDKQIETWNGHWLCHVLNNPNGTGDLSEGLKIESTEVQGNLAIPTKAWSQLIFSLAKKYPNEQITIYAYSLSQTNTTLGFIKVYLPEICRLYEFRDKIFIDKNQTILSDKEIEQLETFYNFKNVCKMGTIGLRSLEPRGLRVYMPPGTFQYAQGKNIDFKKETSVYNLYIIKLWVITMLNKTELLELAGKVASSILGSEKEAQPESRGKTNVSRDAVKILESRSVKNFIENLTEIIAGQPLNAELFKKVIQEVLIMPVDNFPLFLTLIKFEYYYQKSIKE